ncbi:MAG: GNAT family N-acetyltransferase [Promethearchaeota archaeon]
MLQELHVEDFIRVKSLFKDLNYTIAVNAIIEGKSSGRVFVDDIECPEIAFIWDNADGLYLSGYKVDSVTVQAMKELITNILIPKAKERMLGLCFVLYYDQKIEEEKILEIFCNATILRKKGARFYSFINAKLERKEEIPEGFRIRSIDKDLLEDNKIKNINSIIDEINTNWFSVDNFLTQGVGICLLDIKCHTIATWCIADNIVNNCAEIGIETDQKYRSRGFATLIASLMVEYCLINKLVPHWYCWDDNRGSIALAEGLGFSRHYTSELFYICYDN